MGERTPDLRTWALEDPPRPCRTCATGDERLLRLIEDFLWYREHRNSERGLEAFRKRFLVPLGYRVGEKGLRSHIERCIKKPRKPEGER